MIFVDIVPDAISNQFNIVYGTSTRNTVPATTANAKHRTIETINIQPQAYAVHSRSYRAESESESVCVSSQRTAKRDKNETRPSNTIASNGTSNSISYHHRSHSIR